jgi:aspartyl/asparaginyl-tRNA synthetase
LAEFNMIEPEMAFADLQDNMRNAEAYVKAIVRHVLKECEEDLAFFEKFYDKTLMARLKTVRVWDLCLGRGGWRAIITACRLHRHLQKRHIPLESPRRNRSPIFLT